MGVIYQAKVEIKDKPPEFYVGLAKDFKQRWRKHRDSLKYEDSDNHTKLSRFVWKERVIPFSRLSRSDRRHSRRSTKINHVSD